jgi:hypothetical protein
LSAAADVAGQLRLSGSKRPRRSQEITHPERVSGLFILNTCARGRGKLTLPLPVRLFPTPGVGEVLVMGLHLFVRDFVFRVGVVHRERVTLEVRRAYVALHPSWSSRTGVLARVCWCSREIPTSGEGPVAELTARVERGLQEHFRSKPVRIMGHARPGVHAPDARQPVAAHLPER